MQGGALLGLARLRDLAEGEVVEIGLGPSPGVRVRQTELKYTDDTPEEVALTTQLRLAKLYGRRVEAVDIANDGSTDRLVELRLRLGGTARIVDADHPMTLKDGRPLFTLTVPANGAVSVHYTVADR
jgi:hypothetical protein